MHPDLLNTAEAGPEKTAQQQKEGEPLLQRSEAWFEARKGRVTASMVGAILGHSPFMTRADVMRRMVRDWHGAEREFTGNVATDYGQQSEPEALATFEAQSGVSVKPSGFITREEWAGCSPDGLIGENDGLEIKCPYGIRKDSAPRFESLMNQPHYYDQVQFSMWVTGRARWVFYQWTPQIQDVSFVPADPKWVRENIPELRAFWDEFCVERLNNYERHLVAPVRVQIDSVYAESLLKDYDKVNEQIAELTRAKKQILAELIDLAESKDADILGRKLTHVNRAGVVAYAKIVKDHAAHVDVEEYRGPPSDYWVLS